MKLEVTEAEANFIFGAVLNEERRLREIVSNCALTTEALVAVGKVVDTSDGLAERLLRQIEKQRTKGDH